ncbi:MAG: hypothetical protein CMQ34_13905 [Gammaproteobacteria bacterium]|nr:hypothetical protein [Gammaproteobacteria bacterium]|tara:strand:+ start:14139 stop:14699 length:561 start_codon:yes stop_codon:yes gene_type:complete
MTFLVLTALGVLTAVNPQTASAQSIDPLAAAQESFESPVKYAIYSSAWHLNSNAGLRIVAQNQGESPIKLESILFRDETGTQTDATLQLDMVIPAQAWAEVELPYQDLLSGNDCVNRTMADDWKLVEISNYTLNPSVRGLIIENTRSFRIYQCVRNVQTVWYSPEEDTERSQNQWLMYHFERLPLD